MKNAMGYIQWKKITTPIATWFILRNCGDIELNIPVKFTPAATGWNMDYITTSIKNVLSLRICEKTGVIPEQIRILDVRNAPLVKINGFTYLFCIITTKNKDDWYKLYGYFGGIK